MADLVSKWVKKWNIEVDRRKNAEQKLAAALCAIDDLKAEIERHHADFQKWEDMADRASKRADSMTELAARYKAALQLVDQKLEGWPSLVGVREIASTVLEIQVDP